MEFSQPPPEITNMSPAHFSVPPPPISASNPIPTTSVPPPSMRQNFFSGPGKPGHPYFKPFVNFARGPGGLPMTQDDFDGKRLRKSVMRKTVDYNAAIIRALEVSFSVKEFVKLAWCMCYYLFGFCFTESRMATGLSR